MTRPRAAALAVGLWLISNPGNTVADPVEESMAYVAGLPDDCVYDHGYRCMEVSEDDFISPRPDRAWTPGPYMNAWLVSYRDFQQITEMSAQQKELKHYKIGFTGNHTQYIVLYQGLLLPELKNGKVVGTMRVTFGITTKYWIDKKTLKIDKRLFLR